LQQAVFYDYLLSAKAALIGYGAPQKGSDILHTQRLQNKDLAA